MFTSAIVDKKQVQVVHLYDTATQTSVEIVPAWGAMLNAFVIAHQGKEINTIDGIDYTADFSREATASGFKSSKLSPFACRMKEGKYLYKGNTYTIEKFYLAENAIHGLLFDAPFSIVHQYGNENHCGVVLRCHYTGTDQGYPFSYNCEITYQLECDRKLVLTTKITNMHQEAIPVQDGWHPYFTLGGKIDDLQLEFQSAGHVLFNDRLIPTGDVVHYETFNGLKQLGSQFFDDCFQLNTGECQPWCVLRDPAQQLQIEIRPDKSYPFLQVYTPPHRNSIAIENLSAPPDCFNNGIHLLELAPNESAYFNTAYQVKAL